MNQKDRVEIATLFSSFEFKPGKGSTTVEQLLEHFTNHPLFDDSYFQKAYYQAKGWEVYTVDGWHVAIPPNGGNPVNFKRTIRPPVKKDLGPKQIDTRGEESG